MLKKIIGWLLRKWLFITRELFLQKKKNIYIFRYDELGDWVLWLSAAAELRKFYPKGKWRIILIGKPALRELNLQCPYWDEVLDFDIKTYLGSFWYRLRLILKLTTADIVLNPVLNRNFSVDKLIGYSGAPARIGIDVRFDQIAYRPEAERKAGNSYYKKIISLDLTKHILDINADFVSAVTGEKVAAVLDSLAFIPAIKSTFENYAVVLPGAGTVKRCWEPEKFTEIINLLTKENPELKIVLCGTAGEKRLSEQIISGARSRDSVVNCCGKTNLINFCNIIKYSALVIANESGGLHIAASYGVPSVCILGGGHYGLFHPYPERISSDVKSIAVYCRKDCYNCNWHCYKNPYLSETYPCVSAVSIDSVWNEIKKRLQK